VGYRNHIIKRNPKKRLTQKEQIQESVLSSLVVSVIYLLFPVRLKLDNSNKDTGIENKYIFILLNREGIS